MLISLIGRDRVYDGVEIEGGHVGIVLLYEHTSRVMVRRYCHFPRSGIVEVREGYLVFRSYLLSDDDLIYIVEFVPILIFLKHVPE